MVEHSRIRAYSGAAGVLLATLICAGFAGNYFAPRLFIGFSYLLGTIPVLLTVRLFGIRWGLLAGVIAASATVFLFGGPYAMLWLWPEPLLVGWLLAKGKTRNIILCDAIYWTLVGAPLLWVAFRYFMHVAVPGALAAVLMYWVIGITNALLASLLVTYTPGLLSFGDKEKTRSIPIHQLIFNLLMAAVLLPAVAVMVIYGKDAERRYLHGVNDDLAGSSQSAITDIRSMLQQQAAEAVAAGGAQQDFAASRAGQDALKELLLVARRKPSIQLTVMDGTGRIIASTDSTRAVRDLFEPCRDGVLASAAIGDTSKCTPKSVTAQSSWQQSRYETYILVTAVAQGSSWSIIADTPLAPYLLMLIHDYGRALMILVSLNIFALAISLYTSRRLVAPLLQLSRVTTDLPDRLLKGKSTPWPESMVAEIDQLSDNFRTMATALGYKFQEITYYNETLEARVRERTKELTRANAELQREITERQLTERQRDRLMVELQLKNKELEGIVYVASHDLRSPLVNIQGFSRKLGKSCTQLAQLIAPCDMESEERQQLDRILREAIPKSLGFITGSVEKMDGLLKGLLRLSRLGRAALCFETLDMTSIMEKIVSSMAYQIDTLGARVDLGELGYCMADAGQVIQVFSNLLDNALKYHSPDRPLVVRIYSEEFEEGIRYCVEDNGIGIPREQQDAIWEIFHRLNPDDSQGEGLGLTLARRIVARLGGSIWVEPAAQAGSCFYVVLPKPAAAE